MNTICNAVDFNSAVTLKRIGIENKNAAVGVNALCNVAVSL